MTVTATRSRARTPAPTRTRAARPPRRRPELTVVPEGRTAAATRRRARLLGAAIAVAMVTGLFGVAVAHVLLTQGQFRLERLEAKAAEEQARYERLRQEVAQLESPERVVAAAHERLGMIAPAKVTYLASTRASRAADGQGRTAPGEAWAQVKAHLAARP